MSVKKERSSNCWLQYSLSKGYALQLDKYFLALLSLIFIMLASCKSDVKETAPIKFDWRLAAKLPSGDNNASALGLAGPVAGITNNILLIGGGSNFPNGAPWEGGRKAYYNSLYLFKIQKDSLIPMQRDLRLPYNVAYSANCSTPEGIVVAGGENASGALKAVLLIKWDSLTQLMNIRRLPDLPEQLTNAMIAADQHLIYFAGGENADSVSSQFYKLDLNHPEAGWQLLPPLEKPLSNAVLCLQANENGDPCLYLVGGRKKNSDSTSDLYSNVYQFDIKNQQWSEKTSLPYALSAETGLSWDEHHLLVFSGDKGATFHQTELLLTQIAKAKDPAKRKVLIDKKNDLQKRHPGFTRKVLCYNTLNNKWKVVDTIPFPGQVTTTALKWHDQIIIPCGEIRAGVRTANIIEGIFGLRNKI